MPGRNLPMTLSVDPSHDPRLPKHPRPAARWSHSARTMRRSSPRSVQPAAFFVWVLCLGAAGLAGCHSQPSKRAAQYMIQEGLGKPIVGDAEREQYVSTGARIQVLDNAHPDDVTLDLTVSPDGTILVPFVGRMYVAGLSRSQLESYLTERLSPYFLDPPEIYTEISEATRIFWVLGEVEKEGEFRFVGNQTMLDAIVAAVPNRTTANMGRIWLIRADPDDPRRFPFNFNDLAPGGDSSLNYVLQENDIIYVPPTIVAEFGYFLKKLLFPVTAVFEAIGGALFAAGGNRGFNNNNRALPLGGFLF